uniref:BED-type domain-containing protein n=1 Tax=Panagrellus redivivus TaxID=6233 RepID=A0A7E5A159_PANRE
MARRRDHVVEALVHEPFCTCLSNNTAILDSLQAMFLDSNDNPFISDDLMNFFKSNPDALKQFMEFTPPPPPLPMISPLNSFDLTANSGLQYLMSNMTNLSSTLEQETKKGSQPLPLLEPATSSTSVSPSPSSSVAEAIFEGRKRNHRRRTRSSPVWMYFKVEDGFTKCLHCPYSTKSAYSTNLKSHMRTHHPALFDQVLDLEASYNFKTASVQLNGTVLEGIAISHKDDPLAPMTDVALSYNLNGTSFDTSKLLAETHPNLVSSLTASKPINPYRSSEATTFNKNVKKRRCLRRHPVWTYFHDIDEKHIQCNKCTFITLSSYTTNLKMHLRAHHQEEFVDVVTQELQARKEEDSGHSPHTGGKRKRRTAEELEAVLEKYKGKFNMSQNPPVLSPMSNLNDSDTAFLNTMLSLTNNTSAIPTITIESSDSSPTSPPPQQSFDSPQLAVTPASSPAMSFKQLFPNRNPHEELESLQSLFRTLQEMSHSDSNYRTIMQHGREHIIGKFINFIGADQVGLLVTPAFQQLVACLDPNYAFPKDVNTLINWARAASENDNKTQ